MPRSTSTLDSLSKAQDPRVNALREDLNDFIEVQRRKTKQIIENNEQEKKQLATKRIENVEQLAKLDSELRQSSKVFRLQEQTERPLMLPDTTVAASSCGAPVQMSSTGTASQEELIQGMQDLVLQRQILMWLGLAVDMDAVDALGLAACTEKQQTEHVELERDLDIAKKPDIASRAVASVLLAHRANVPSPKETTSRTLVDLGIVAAYHQVKMGSGFKEFVPSDTGLHKLQSELEAQIRTGAHLTLQEQNARNRANRLFQCAVRAKNARRRFVRRKTELIRGRAAQVIQSQYRGRLGRKRVAKLQRDRLEARLFEHRQRRVDLAEKDLIAALGSDDEYHSEGDENASLQRVRRANCSYRQLIRSLPPKTVASLSKHKKHGQLYTLLLLAVLGKKQFGRALKRQHGSGLEFADDDLDDPTTKLRHRIWQLESDVAALREPSKMLMICCSVFDCHQCCSNS